VITERYIKEYDTDRKLLGVRYPDVAPKVTESIPEIIKLIEGLVANGTAYVAEDGEVFYAVRKFKEYGKLSGKKIDDLLVGARVQPDEKKKDPLDFSLWKPQKNSDEPAWDSPWCKGRPGWHIECSAMGMQHLGETFDLHGGGRDLIHPHHENEIAQSEGFTHKPYVKYWMHNNMLTFQAEKMSKSIGNIVLTREFIEKYSAEVLKFILLSGHYTSTIDFSDKSVKDAQSALHRYYTTKAKCQAFESSAAKSATPATPEETALLEMGKTFESKWREAMDDDFNTAKPLGTIFEYVRALNAYLDKKGFKPSESTTQIAKWFLQNMEKLSSIFNILGMEPKVFLNQLKEQVLTDKNMNAEDIAKLIQERTAARQKKDFATSDRIRDELLAKGIVLQDKATETEWDIVFSS
jgi:cysteinyl-tRNA synthetase